MQNTGSRIASQASGAAITGAIDGAIADGLGGSTGTPPPADGAGLGGPPSNLGAGSDQMSRLGAFSAPSYAGMAGRSSAAPAQGQWKSWASVRGSGWDQDDRNPNAGGLKGSQINATFGMGRLIAPGVLIGVVGGYESFSYDVTGVNGRLKGDGWTAGGYLGWAITRTLRFDVAGTWTGLSYDATAGTAAGSFSAGRWLASTGLTGTYRANAFVIEPSTRIYALWEHQGSWTDSRGTGQAERGFSVGRSSTGAKVSYPLPWSAGVTLAPYVGMYGDYRFASDSSTPVNQPVLGLRDGWSARATTGVVMTLDGGTRLSIDGELGGIGSGDQSIWTVSGRGAIPF